MYNALPNSVRRRDFIDNGFKPLNPAQQALSLYRNTDKIDAMQALKNIALDEVGDRVIGAFSKAANRITKNPHWDGPFGVQVGNRWRGPNPYLHIAY